MKQVTSIREDKKQIERELDKAVEYQNYLSWQRQIVMDPALRGLILDLNERILQNDFSRIEEATTEHVDLQSPIDCESFDND